MSLLTFDHYQEEAGKTAIYPNIGHNLWYPALGLCGESGEVAENVKKVFRDDGGVVSPDRMKRLTKELGDALWYISNIASELGVSLGHIADENLLKLQDRAERDKLHGSGDQR